MMHGPLNIRKITFKNYKKYMPLMDRAYS